MDAHFVSLCLEGSLCMTPLEHSFLLLPRQLGPPPHRAFPVSPVRSFCIPPVVSHLIACQPPYSLSPLPSHSHKCRFPPAGSNWVLLSIKQLFKEPLKYFPLLGGALCKPQLFILRGIFSVVEELTKNLGCHHEEFPDVFLCPHLCPLHAL